MGIFQKAVACAEHEYSGKQIPLNFQQAIGADVEGFANNRVACADQGGGKNQPHAELADQRIKPINQTRKGQKSRHIKSPA